MLCVLHSQYYESCVFEVNTCSRSHLDRTWEDYMSHVSLNRERESFPHGFPLHRITLESDRAPCFHLHHQKGASVPPAIIKGPIQPARDDRITLRPKTKLSLPLVSPVPPILHFRCLSGHVIWASSAFKSSWEFHIYKLGSQCQMRSNHFGARWHGKETAIHLITSMCTIRMILKLNFTLKMNFDISRYQNCFKESPEFPHSRHCGEVHVCSTSKYDLSGMTSMQHNTCFVFSAWTHSESPSDTSTWNSLSKKVRHPFSSQNFYSQI